MPMQVDPVVLAEIVDKIKVIVNEKFPHPNGNPFAMTNVIGELLTQTPSDNWWKWSMDHYLSNKMAPCIPKLVKLYNILKKHGRDYKTIFEHGRGDRCVGYVDYPKNKILVFTNQNVTWLVMLVPTNCYDRNDLANVESNKIKTYSLHIRFMTKTRHGREYACPNPEKINYNKIIEEYFTQCNITDRGYAFSLEAETFVSYGKRWHKSDSRGYTEQYIFDEVTWAASMVDEYIKELNNECV